MLEFSIGDVVVSTRGRDMGEMYVILEIKGDYLFLANGKNKTIDTPKPKKMKHIQKTIYHLDEIAQRLQNDEKVLDREIRKAIDNLNIM